MHASAGEWEFPDRRPSNHDMTTDLKLDEELRLFPVIAAHQGSQWKVVVHAWVYEPERNSLERRAALLPLRAALGLIDGDGDTELFAQRARAFLVDNERGKRVVVDIAERRYELERTDADGHSRTELQVPADALSSGPTPVVAVLPDGDTRRFAGVIHPLPGNGMSVISDIDDTIKVTEVRSHRATLRNTFLRPFEAVPGMSTVYASWARQGTSFHYVSASPWQLYADLDALFIAAGFPAGSVHLKSFRWKDESFFSLFQKPLEYKGPIIRGLLADCAPRAFVLVGDSGEADPEIYATMYQEAPSRVRHIFIRDVTGEPRHAERYARVFARVPADRWTVFTDPGTLSAAL